LELRKGLELRGKPMMYENRMMKLITIIFSKGNRGERKK
jgi:hypothetical protein